MTATPNTSASVEGSTLITFRQFIVSVYCTHGYQRHGKASHSDIGRTSILDILGPVQLNAVESVVVDLGRLARRKDFTEPKSAEQIVGMIAIEGEYGRTGGVTA